METNQPSEREPQRTGELLALARDGDTRALSDLVGQVHSELCTLAHSVRRGWTPAPSLSTLEIVSEAYLRMRGGQTPGVTDRRHFMNLAAKTMRWIIISHYRNADRRPELACMEQVAGEEQRVAREYIALDAALEALEAEQPELSQLVELRYFLGRDMREIAEIMEIPERSLYRLWERARRWLHRALAGEPRPPRTEEGSS